MDTFSTFVQKLMYEGSVRFHDRLVLEPEHRPRTERILREAFAIHRLDVAGPTIAFDAPTALETARVLADACWFLVSEEEPEAEVERALQLAKPQTASQHLSGDLCLRFAPTVYRRALAIRPKDVLTRELERLLRDWPLSGSLAALAEEPDVSLTFDDHPGLRLLYEERTTNR